MHHLLHFNSFHTIIMNKESDSITSEQEMVADDLSEVLSSSSDDDTVGNDNNIQCCEICIAEKSSENPNMGQREVRKLCKTTYMGCLTCRSYVCGQHWSKHGQNNSSS